jgi:hypothetical protein
MAGDGVSNCRAAHTPDYGANRAANDPAGNRARYPASNCTA